MVGAGDAECGQEERTIEASDAQAAEAEAAKLFGLSEEQRKRLAIWEHE
jgi:hypothetical protein